MKKRYVKTEMEIIEFDVEDIITDSNTENSEGTGEGGGEDTII